MDGVGFFEGLEDVGLDEALRGLAHLPAEVKAKPALMAELAGLVRHVRLPGDAPAPRSSARQRDAVLRACARLRAALEDLPVDALGHPGAERLARRLRSMTDAEKLEWVFGKGRWAQLDPYLQSPSRRDQYLRVLERMERDAARRLPRKRGRPLESKARALEVEVAVSLTRAGFEVRHYVDGVAARVLRALRLAAGLPYLETASLRPALKRMKDAATDFRKEARATPRP